jgi:hypothetical protein
VEDQRLLLLAGAPDPEKAGSSDSAAIKLELEVDRDSKLAKLYVLVLKG